MMMREYLPYGGTLAIVIACEQSTDGKYEKD
jgi:hypothetical protein